TRRSRERAAHRGRSRVRKLTAQSAFPPPGRLRRLTTNLDPHLSGVPVMDLISTLAGSMMEGHFPKGWDLAKIDRLAAAPPPKPSDRQAWWTPHFEPVACATFEDFDTFMGHEIALEVQRARQANRPIAFILPVGPMGTYRWAVYF